MMIEKSIVDWKNTRYYLNCPQKKLFGSGYVVYGSNNGFKLYIRHKGFKFHLDIGIYSDEKSSDEVLSIVSRSKYSFWGPFDVLDPINGQVIGTLTRGFWKSSWQVQWSILNAQGNLVANLREVLSLTGVVSRLTFKLSRQYMLHQGTEQVLSIIQNYGRNGYHLTVCADEQKSSTADPRMIVALSVLLAVVEGRRRM